MSSFYDKVQPLIKRVEVRTRERFNTVSMNKPWIDMVAYGERMRLLFAASELSANDDGRKVYVDRWTPPVDREEFVKHLHMLAGESTETVWVEDQEGLDRGPDQTV